MKSEDIMRVCVVGMLFTIGLLFTTTNERTLSTSEKATLVAGGGGVQQGAPGWCVGIPACVVPGMANCPNVAGCTSPKVNSIDPAANLGCNDAATAGPCTAANAGICTFTQECTLIGGVCVPNIAGDNRNGARTCTDSNGTYP